jgi:hypothetical protein
VTEGSDSKPPERSASSARAPLGRCAAHGLYFDPTQSNGCVLCRRASAAPDRPGQRRKPWVWIAAGCVALALAVASIRAAATRSPPTLDRAPPLARSANVPGAQGDDAERRSPGDVEPGRQADPARALELRDRDMAAALDALGKCQDPECELVRMTYAAGGDTREQLRRAEIAPDLLARECDAGKVAACEGLRLAYGSEASTLPKDSAKTNEFGAKANQLLDRQCESGDRVACKTLIRQLLHRQPTDVPRGRRLADAACASGDHSECWALGEFLARPGPDQDRAAANSYFARAIPTATTRCDAGDASACQMLAQAYRLGQGTPRDEKKYSAYLLKLVNLTVKP